MRHHPLTPMTDANVVRLLTPQTTRPVHLITNEVIDRGVDAVRRRVDELSQTEGGIVVVDTITDAQLVVIAEATAHLTVVTGGSGLATTLPRAWGFADTTPTGIPAPQGARAVIAGSVSQATNQQVAVYPGPKFQIDPRRILRGANVVQEAIDWAAAAAAIGDTPLIYSTAMPEAVAKAQESAGAELVGQAVEDALAAIGRGLVESGVRQLVVAGGETSGACVRALEIRELRVGEQIDPGVPWAYGGSFAGGMHIALKSGNFGRPEFFTTAFEVLGARN